MNFRQVLIAVLVVQVTSNEIKTLFTNGYHYSQYFPLEENMSRERILRFSVRTSRDAHILLAPSHQVDGQVYEIVVGAYNNTMNFIRGRCPCQEEPSATIRTFQLLNQHEFRNFWIRLKADGRRTYIQVGMGGKDTPFQEWRDPRPLNVQYLSFRSGARAEWRYGYSDATYTTGLSVDRRHSVVTSTGYGQYFPLSEVVSHSEDAVTLYFTVRTSKEFQILLSPEVSFLGDVYEFGITESGAYISRRHLGDTKAIYQRDGFLNERERLEFWIKLTTDGQVMLGTGRSPIPVLQWLDPRPIYPQFVSFTLHSSRNPNADANSYADVQYGLGPDYTFATQDCTPRWKQASSKRLPPGSVRGGYDDQDDLFVCRAKYDGNTIPAGVPHRNDARGECQVTWSWSPHSQPNFETLTGCRFSWAAESHGVLPEGAIAAGDVNKKTPLYAARRTHKTQLILGYLQTEYKVARVSLNHQENQFALYEVLVHRPRRL